MDWYWHACALSVIPRCSVWRAPFPTIEDARKLVEHSTDLLHPLLSDYKLRQQTLQVKRTVSCACSQITRHDPVHCLDRTRYLMAFLSGEPVKISGVATGKQDSGEVTLSQMLPGDLGTVYAWQCLFSATLSQAEHQFAHNLEIAVTFASVLSGILSQHPDRIPEFFARIFLVCPTLCAFTDDTACSLARTMLESGDLLARWRGTARLFAALLIAQPPSPLRLKRPPHLNPALLWRVIAGMINKPFIPCATAEILHGLLEVGGTTLLDVYGVQSERLLSTITNCINSSPSLRDSSPEIALLSTIELARKSGQFPYVPAKIS
ncbi:hypothetical protein P879_01010 [Paragonimus westermani]|uniref:mRNA export factor GLE1 n=1 Tax=Paragonimus westermani TaxID=34504 RepID=A0A8T0DIU2_9TREM|nr:hypothetical protein P879_01010 [Paragonimus westermani]